MRGLILSVAVTMLACTTTQAKDDQVVLETSMGDITLRLFADKAPVSVKNFERYVDEGFYDGTVFHRVIPTFMIQGGGMTKDLAEKPTHEAIKNEAGNGLSNKRGTLAMARTGVIDSATSQFFINVVDNTRLDHTGNDPMHYGYAVFGEVVEGMDVVDKIRNVTTLCPSTTPAPCSAGLPPGMRDVPAVPVVIIKAYRKK